MAKKSVKKPVKEEKQNIQEKTEIKEQKTKKEPYTIANFFSKYENLLFNPTEFLNSIESESRYQPVLRAFVLFYLVYFILTFVISLIFTGNSMNIWQIIQSFIYAIIISVIIPFLISAFIWLGVRIFKGKQGFFNIFKPITYALIIILIYSFISFIFALVIPFNAISTETLASISQNQAVQLWKDFFFQPGAIINSLISLISLIHLFIFSIIGISKFQKITKSKAAFGIILGAVIALIVLVLYVIISYFANPNSIDLSSISTT